MTFAEYVACHEAFAQTAYVGVKTTVACDYPGNKLSNTVYLCKVNNNSGECEESSRTAGRRSMAGLGVAMAQVSPADQGVYWCTFGSDSYRAAFKNIKLSVEGEARPKNRPGNNVDERQVDRSKENFMFCQEDWRLLAS